MSTDERNAMTDRYHTSTLAWISRVVGKKKWYIIFLLIIEAFLGASNVAFAMLFRDLIDQAVAKSLSGFWIAVVRVALLLGLQTVLYALERFLYEWSRSAMENQFKGRLFSCLLHKDYASVTAIHSGEWMNRLTSDTVVVANGVADILPDLAGLVTKLIGALIAIFMLEPVFAYVLIPGGLLLLAVTYAFRKILKRLHKRIREADGAVRVFLQERLGSLVVIRTFAMEARTEEEASEKMDRHKAARIKRNHFSNLCNSGFGLVADGLYLLSAAYCGYGILRGTTSYGTMMAILQLVGQVQSPFANITGYLPQYYAMIASAERLMEAEAYEDDCAQEAKKPEEIAEFYQASFRSIGLRNAAFTYRPTADEAANGDSTGKNIEKLQASMPVVFSGINLEVHRGEYVAITGPSGCGKSTVLKLLMCLYPLDSGERYLTAADGSDFPLAAQWRGLFAYVPQGNQLMSGTIREIIAFGDKEKMQQEERMNQALRIACADEFVSTLERGLDTVLGERGTGLSEGQMQRIAIARAVFSDHPILMLDESTSALDETTEQHLLANLKAMTDKTVLIVTHRPAVLQICDKQIAFPGN